MSYRSETYVILMIQILRFSVIKIIIIVKIRDSITNTSYFVSATAPNFLAS